MTEPRSAMSSALRVLGAVARFAGAVVLALVVCAVLLIGFFLPGLMMHPISELVPIPALMLLIGTGFVFGAWRATRLLLRRRYRRAAALAAALVACAVGLVYAERALTHANALYWQERIAEEVLATSDLDNPIYFYDSDQCILVYGCSLAIFELPAALEQRFHGPRVHDPEHRPRVPERWGSRYKAVAWTGTPIPDAYVQHLDFVLAQDPRVRDAQVLPYAEQIRSVTSRPGSYLGWIYSGGSSEFKDPHLFAIDLDGRRILFASRYWQG